MQKNLRGILLLSLALTATVAVLTGCPKHEDFPQAINLQVPPTPSNFVITQPDTMLFDYDFNWSVDDPTHVEFYRVYLSGQGVGPDELLTETNLTAFLATFPFSASGVRFAVSAVSEDHVEGAKAHAVAP
jgi:hypothetical protein